MKKIDKFLQYTSYKSKVILEDCIAADLGLNYDSKGKESEYLVKENFDSFFKFYNSELNGIEIEDLNTNDEFGIVGFVDNGQYVVCSTSFKLTTKYYSGSIKEKWDAINIACHIYLDLYINFNEIQSNYYIEIFKII